MFVVIDGIDGSGKGTQVALLEKKLRAQGKTVLVLDYPRYGEKSAYFVEKYLNGEYGEGVSAKQASMFYALDRFDDYKRMKTQMLEYDYIISNRYVSASMIHQAGKIKGSQEREEFLKWLDDLEYNILGIARPDLTLLLNVTPQTSKKLLALRDERKYIKNSQNLDIHEADDSHMKNAWESAMKIVEFFDDWERLDCEKDGELMSIAEINALILQRITK